ncbi:MAG: signal peptidase I, partial [Silvanigrellaceae bacterium]|nr:signal peptidase I [Silvanigrellaceae bacterium]
FMKLIDELKSILVIVSIIFFIRSSLINWYVVPTGSMLPTIKIGDRTVVNKLSYGFMLPFMETRMFSWDSPKRGDIVVFKGPESQNGLTLIKRVVGISGDVVKFTGGVLTVNGVLAKETLQDDRKVLDDIDLSEDTESKYLFLESDFSKFPHFILRKKFGGPTNNETKTWVIPQNKLLLVGDNRDSSLDGRAWGFMDENRIYGRAFLVSYSTSNYHQKTLIPVFRSDRWFKLIEN